MISRAARACTLVLSTLALGVVDGCAAPEDTTATGSAEAVSVSPRVSVDSAMSALHEQRTVGELAKYYEDGVRIEACWANPAGNKLTDVKKAFYCSMPLEFRICNTVVLLSTNDAQVDERYSGYLDCQKRVDAAFGRSGRFVYSDAINQTYKDLFLRGESGLTKEAEDELVTANKPKSSGRSFPILLLEVLKGLAGEAVDLASTQLDELFKDVIAKKTTPE
jgi:hypothetical protein